MQLVLAALYVIAHLRSEHTSASSSGCLLRGMCDAAINRDTRRNTKPNEQPVMLRLPGPPLKSEEGMVGRRMLSSNHPTGSEKHAWRLQHEELRRERNRVLAIGTPLTHAAARAAGAENSSAHLLFRSQQHTSINNKQRLGVCIIGQRARLELSSKIKHVVRPLSLLYDIDVVLSVSPNKRAIFANKGSDAGGQMQWTDNMIKERIRVAFKTSGNTNGVVIVDSTAQELLPMLHYTYVIKGDKYGNRLHLKEQRARAHVRQWAALWRCYAHFVELEGANGEPYSAFIKLRDDSLVLAPIAGMLNVTFLKNVVVFKQCNGWGGLNDKVAVLDAKFGYAFFGAPLIDWYFNINSVLHVKSKLPNPESYLKAIMKLHNVSVKLVVADHLPVITSRAYGDTKVATCFPLGRYKIGVNASCVSEHCEIRKRIYCQRCPGVNGVNTTSPRAEWSEEVAKRHVLQGCVSTSELSSWTCDNAG